MGGSRAGTSGDFADVDIAEVIIFDRALTAGERNEVGFALEQRYGLDTAFVPEPASGVLAGLGLLGLALFWWRRRK